MPVASGLSSVWSPFAGGEFTPELKQYQPQSPSPTAALPRLCNQRSSHSVMSDSCDTMDSSPPGSSVHGISQARRLEWVVISFSRGSSPPRD